MRIAFHSNQLSLRGTEVALYDYAHYNEKLLGNESVIITHRNAPFHHVKAIEKFGKRFPVFVYNEATELESLITQSGAEVLYCIKAGIRDQIIPRNIRTVVHAVFRYYEPHGDVYAYVSEWLARDQSKGQCPFVPHMIDLPRTEENLRQQLDIPRDAIVFGRYGGYETFDINFAREAVVEVAAQHPERYFIFLFTERFGPSLPNLRFLEGNSDPLYKVQFINSCDAMLHARQSGETFGLAVGEFSSRNKPIITWDGSVERAHLEVLQEKALTYTDKASLKTILEQFTPSPGLAWDCYSSRFSPDLVMKAFKDVFLA